MKSKKSIILESNDKTGGNQDGGRKDERIAELANFKRSQEYTKVFGISQLLSVIYQGFYIYN